MIGDRGKRVLDVLQLKVETKRLVSHSVIDLRLAVHCYALRPHLTSNSHSTAFMSAAAKVAVVAGVGPGGPLHLC